MEEKYEPLKELGVGNFGVVKYIERGKKEWRTSKIHWLFLEMGLLMMLFKNSFPTIELQVKDADDSSTQPKCETDTGNSLGNKNDTKNKVDGKNAKKTTSLKSGSVPIEKKNVNSKPAIAQVKAHLTKQPGKSDFPTSTANEGVRFLLLCYEEEEIVSLVSVEKQAVEKNGEVSKTSTLSCQK